MTGTGGNATVDTNGHTIALTGPLLGAGGLTKTGAGTLILSGTNSYGGPTTVSTGILVATTPGSLPGYNSSGSISVASGAAVGGYAASSGYWSEANFAGLLANANWKAGAALAISTDYGSYNYTSTLSDGGSAGTVSIGLTKLGSNTLTLSAANNYTGLTTVKAGTLELAPAAQNAVFNLGGADIQSGKIVFDYAGGADPVAMIQSLLAASYDGGRWDVGQFRDSTAATTGLTLGYLDDTSLHQVKVMATYAGDFNLDGVVDNLDRAIWFASAFTGTTWQQGNANYDGVVDGLDRDLWFSHVGLRIPRASPSGPSIVGASAPEPGTLVLLAAGLAGLLAYVRRRQK